MSKISDVLAEIRPEFQFKDAEDFFAEGMLDSFDLMTLVATLDKTYGISIDGQDILPENFRNCGAIERLLTKYGVVP
jgi:acyl carrier protein